MKFGIKIWSTNKKLIKAVKNEYKRGAFDYIELSAILGTYDPALFSCLKGIPVIIHCDNCGVNFAKKDKINAEAIKEAQLFADYLKSPYIIIHPGYGGSVKNCQDLITKTNDKRLCLENMPGELLLFNDLDFIGRSYEELKKFKVNNYCLDIGHAIKASNIFNMDPYVFIESLLKLKPKVIHLMDGHEEIAYDEHLNIGEGNYDFKKILNILSRVDVPITFETPRKNLNNFSDDRKNLERIESLS